MFILDLVRNALPGIQHGDGADTGDDQYHQRTRHIDAILDAPWGHPVTNGIGNRPAGMHLPGNANGNAEHHPAHEQGTGPGQTGFMQQQAYRCRNERYGDLQGREVTDQHTQSLTCLRPGYGYRLR